MRHTLSWWNKNMYGLVEQRVRGTEDNFLKQEIALTEEWTLEKNIKLIRLHALYQQARLREEVF